MTANKLKLCKNVLLVPYFLAAYPCLRLMNSVNTFVTLDKYLYALSYHKKHYSQFTRVKQQSTKSYCIKTCLKK